MGSKGIKFVTKLIIAMIVVTLGVAVYFTNRYITFKQDNINGLNAVKVNDVIKNAQDLLFYNSSEALRNSLKEYGYGLVIYDIRGEIIFDNEVKFQDNTYIDLKETLARDNKDKELLTITDKAGNLVIASITMEDVKQEDVLTIIWISAVIFILILLGSYSLLYFYIIRPFNRLEAFTGQVAKGNLEIPLIIERENIFGSFTWAFDMLRNELKSSKLREKEAEKAKKELVAVLSHDIRTPISAIRAYAEGLLNLQDKSSERAERYLQVIINKTDEIAKLSQDMFLHAISDLEKLEITIENYPSRLLLNAIIEPLILNYENRIIITNEFPDQIVVTDKARLAQVFDNIVANAVKYASESNIEINAYISEGMLICSFKDFGNGVLPEDISFIFDKFFRGKNAKNSGKDGSGIGLYISKYILEKTGGNIKAYNIVSGFVVEVSIKLQ